MNKHPNTKHGMHKTRIYSIWVGMKTRCLNKNHMWFKHYGGRGITIDEDWKVFSNFMRDMLDSYYKHVEKYGENNTTLDRKDANKGYSKENCGWATRSEQSNNARNNIKIKYDGKEKTLIEWSKHLGISYGKLYLRVFKSKMPIEIAFSQTDFRINKLKK